MKHGKILKGEPFDWKAAEQANETLAEAADENGRLDPDEVPWGAAMMADPGVCKCPDCQEILWREGEVLECPECQTWLFVRSGKPATTASKYLERYGYGDLTPNRAQELLGQKTVRILAQGAPCGGNEVSMSGAAFQISALWLLSEGRGDEFIEVVE